MNLIDSCVQLRPSGFRSSGHPVQFWTRLATLGLVVSLLAGCGASTWSKKASSALAGVEASSSVEDRLHAGELALLVRADLPAAKKWLTSVFDEPKGTSATAARAGLGLAYIATITGDTNALASALARVMPLATPHQAELAVRLTNKVWGNSTSTALEGELEEAVYVMGRKAGAQWQPARDAANAVLRTLSQFGTDSGSLESAYAETGVLTTWKLSAPWGQAPADDSQRMLGPEKRVLGTTELTGSGWAKRERKPWTLRFSDGEVGFPEMGSDGGVGFAETWVETRPGGDRRVVIGLETNRDVSLWVNGTLVMHIDSLRRRQSSYKRIGVTLPEGRSRVLLKLATVRAGGFARVIVGGLNGADMVGPKSVLMRLGRIAASKGEINAGPVATFAAPATVVDDLQRSAGAAFRVGDSGRAIRALLSLDSLSRRPVRNTDAAYRALAALKSALPKYPGLGLAEARLLSLDPEVGGAQARGQRRTALEAVQGRWPTNVPVMRQLARLEIADGRHDEGLTLLRKALSVSPKDLGTRLAEMLLYRERGWEAEAVASAQALAKDGARAPRIWQEVVDLYRHFGRSREAGIALDAMEASFPQQAVVRRARWLGDRGKLEERAKRLLVHWKRHPERFTLARRAVRALRASGDTKAAGAVVGQILSVRPADAWALSERVLLALDRGDEGGRRRALDRALRIRPDLLEMSSLKGWLLGTPAPETQVADSRVLVAAYRAKLAKEANAGGEGGLAKYPVVTLLDRTAIDVGDDGYSRQLTHVVRVVQSKAGADKLGELRPPRDAQLLLVRSIKADGRVLWPDRVAGKPDLSFKGLAPGDAVEWAWIRNGDVRPEEGGYITGLSFAFWNVPTLRKEVDVSVSPRFRLAQHVRNGAPPPKVTSTKGATSALSRQRYRWAVDSLPAVQKEPLAANARLFFPYIDLTLWPASSTVPNTTQNATDAAWRAIARGYKARLDRLTQPGPRAKKTAKAASQRSGKPGTSALWAAFDYVKEEINHTERFNTFTLSAEEGLAAQKGNRNVVMVAVGRALGAKTDLVLCTPRQNGLPVDAAHPLPNANRFWYPVVRIQGKTPADVLYADPSRPYNPFGILPRAMYGARCLDLEAASAEKATTKTAFIHLPSYDRYEGTPLGWTFDVTLDVDASGAAKGTLSGTGFGPVASGLRHVYLNADERKRDQLWQQWTASVIQGATVVEWNVEDEVDADRPISWTIRFTVGQFAAVDGKSFRASKLMASTFANYLGSVPKLEQLIAAPRRQTPLALAPHAEDVRLTVRFAGAPGKLATTLRPVDIDGPLFGALQTVVVKGNTLTVERSLAVGPGRVAPSKYPAFRKQLLGVLQGFSQGATLER